MPCIPSESPFLSLKQAAQYLNRSVKTVQRRIDEGALIAHRLGGRWVIKWENLKRFIDNLPDSL